MNRDTEVLKERKGSRGYQGWTDWMPRAHWYGITLPCLHGRFGLPHVCGSCLRASPAALHTLAPSIQSPLPASSLCRHQRSPCLVWFSRAPFTPSSLHAKFAKMFSWLPPAAASKAHHLNVGHPSTPKASFGCTRSSLQNRHQTNLPPGRKLGN